MISKDIESAWRKNGIRWYPERLAAFVWGVKMQAGNPRNCRKTRALDPQGGSLCTNFPTCPTGSSAIRFLSRKCHAGLFLPQDFVGGQAIRYWACKFIVIDPNTLSCFAVLFWPWAIMKTFYKEDNMPPRSKAWHFQGVFRQGRMVLSANTFIASVAPAEPADRASQSHYWKRTRATWDIAEISSRCWRWIYGHMTTW